ncbi:ATP-binding protein [Gracilinema caldarium]|uniref:ATP-binding protein n=1 Tax=Gracilinema caldarium TaxID=215591 RepID=UPI0016AB4389|nr:ATP-binding protein [Gracilinema caldarium]NLJ09528.1 ATP-binding protein [Treponema sp.]
MINEKYIPRLEYLEKIKPFMGKNLIKVLTGQRRVGKSYMLFQIMDEIARQGPETSILYINKELHDFWDLRTGEDLYRYARAHKKNDGMTALLIDEIQEIEHFEDPLRSLLAEGGWDIYCTGSNAELLSGELATYLAGRHIEIEIHPLSYREFLQFHKLENTVESLNNYLRFGGLPYLASIGLTEAVVLEYLKNVQSSILLKDVVAREKIRQIDFLETLLEYLADNVGNLFSATSISKYLKSQRISVPVPTILSYLRALERAFIIRKARRTDIRGMKIFEVGEKYYFEDLGLRNILLGSMGPTEIGKLIENAVYLHLIERGFRVTIGWLDGYEIDFVAEKNDKKIYVQAAYLIVNEDTKKREYGNLERVDDNYPKYVVSMDEIPGPVNVRGIRQIKLRDFLLDNLE